MARENVIEGLIEVAFEYNEDCSRVAYQVQEKLGHGIDEEVNAKMKLMIKLCQEYEVPIEGCQGANENFKVRFKLE